MEVSFFQKDTIKYIEVDMNGIAEAVGLSPLKNIDIMLYVKGTFCVLNFANLLDIHNISLN